MKKIFDRPVTFKLRTLLRGVAYALIFFHLSSIVLHAVTSAYYSYVGFYDIKPLKQARHLGTITNSALYNFYGKLSGTECGYGFFAPNIRSGGALLIDACGKKITPAFSTHEGRLRFESFVGELINDFVKDEKKHVNETIREVKDRYNKLLLKNIALKTLKDQDVDCDLFFISYCLLDFPSLADVRKTGNTEVVVQPLKMYFITKN